MFAYQIHGQGKGNIERIVAGLVFHNFLVPIKNTNVHTNTHTHTHTHTQLHVDRTRGHFYTAFNLVMCKNCKNKKHYKNHYNFMRMYIYTFNV